MLRADAAAEGRMRAQRTAARGGLVCCNHLWAGGSITMKLPVADLAFVTIFEYSFLLLA
jgi:hypothetical protein